MVLAEGSPVRATRCTALENLSTLVRMVVFSSDSSRSVIKSMAMCNPGRRGVGSGWRSPEDDWLVAIVHTAHVEALGIFSHAGPPEGPMEQSASPLIPRVTYKS